MAILEKIRLKTGLKQHNKFDLSFKHVTTQDFFRPKITYFKELVPTESIQLQMSCFSRLDPLIKPMYGHIQIINRFFFVPFRTIFESWNDFLTGTKHTFVSSVGSFSKFVTSVPYIQNDAICYMFANDTTLATESTGDQRYDLYTNGHKFLFTVKGKLFFDILVTLGYKITGAYKVSGIDTADNTKMSALPLLAFAKIYYDWYSNPQYANRDVLAPFFKGDRTLLSSADISTILENCLQLTYDSDYFVSAWDKPQSPNGASLQGFDLSDSSQSYIDLQNKVRVTVANQDSSTVGNVSQTPIIASAAGSSQGGASTTTGSFSQLALDTLHRATHYVMRYMASGNRALDRMFAEYGVKLDSEKLNRCDYIGKFDVNFDISDVMQTTPDSDSGTTESDGYGLGNYSGKGLGFNQNTLKFSTDEFGFLICVSYAAPNVNQNKYVDGRPYYLQHLTKLDFFHGDFDSLGTRPIRSDELYGNILTKPEDDTLFKPSSVWGWTPKYSEYKCVPTDMLSGDMLLKSKNTLLNSWTLYRRFNNLDNYDVHNYDFTVGKTRDFLNIWQLQRDDFDHLYTIYNFKVTSYMPMKPLYDIFDFDEEGKTIMTQLGGSKVTD